MIEVTKYFVLPSSRSPEKISWGCMVGEVKASTRWFLWKTVFYYRQRWWSLQHCKIYRGVLFSFVQVIWNSVENFREEHFNIFHRKLCLILFPTVPQPPYQMRCQPTYHLYRPRNKFHRKAKTAFAVIGYIISEPWNSDYGIPFPPLLPLIFQWISTSDGVSLLWT